MLFTFAVSGRHIKEQNKAGSHLQPFSIDRLESLNHLQSFFNSYTMLRAGRFKNGSTMALGPLSLLLAYWILDAGIFVTAGLLKPLTGVDDLARSETWANLGKNAAWYDHSTKTSQSCFFCNVTTGFHSV